MTEQQELFATEYARSGNATQAAIYAGYSKEHASNQGYRLTRNDEVMKKVAEVKSQMAEDLRNKMSAEASSAFEVLTSIMYDEDAKDADRIKCAVEVLDRAGFITESKVNLDTNMVYEIIIDDEEEDTP